MSNTYKEINNYYVNLERAVNDVQKNTLNIFQHLYGIASAVPGLLQSLENLKKAESGPLSHVVDYISTFYGQLLNNYLSGYEQLIEAITPCVEMKLHFQNLHGQLQIATKDYKRSQSSKINAPEAKQVSLNSNKSFCMQAAQFERQRLINYANLLDMSEQIYVRHGAGALQATSNIVRDRKTVKEAAVAQELSGRLSGLEFSPGENVQQLIAQTFPGAFLQNSNINNTYNSQINGKTQKDLQYSISNTGYKIVREYSDE